MRSKRNPTRFSYSTGASRIFSGSTENPTVETLSYICDALDISMSDFFQENTAERLEDNDLLRTIYRLSSYQREILLQFIESITTDTPSR